MHSACPSRDKLSNGIVLVKEKSWPREAKKTFELLEKFRWEILQHPSYNPDIAPCDSQIFGPLKKSLKGQMFTCDKEGQETVENWIHQEPRSFYTEAIHSLPMR
ncbi:hypothetical protein AVEN_99770-1 [Araneus ventricosus]|uniref:Histone-lysine N-methyltransferase SETMAR n=1 Tax=Araneus ventricosus TaxID=182803 RepID=A0A4Y2DJJ1_ARAVE|nr:hypothetical protein AVEN_99770-1 [Araneus ventricosus]